MLAFVLLVLNVGKGWVAGEMGWLLLVMTGIIPENSLLSTSKLSSVCLFFWFLEVFVFKFLFVSA